MKTKRPANKEKKRLRKEKGRLRKENIRLRKEKRRRKREKIREEIVAMARERDKELKELRVKPMAAPRKIILSRAAPQQPTPKVDPSFEELMQMSPED